MGSAYWQHFEHQADIGIRGFGETKAQAFEQVALAMTAVITDLSLVRPAVMISITCNSHEDDTLLFDWMNALIYEMATRKMLFVRFDVMIANGILQANVYGEAIDRQRHQPAVEIKGATYTELDVYRQGQYWIAQCVIDV